jgi:hypothetical protein
MAESRTEAAEMYDLIAGDESTIRRHWKKTTDDSNTCGVGSGGVRVRQEHEGDRLGPPFHEVAIYFKRDHRILEVARWPLDEAPADPMPAVRRRLDGDADVTDDQ